MSDPADALSMVRSACDTAAALVAGTRLAASVDGIRSRLDGPLRVAIAGRVKAGKSTLLNALVGERLAPTDAGECTRVVTWYHEAVGYEVRARLHSGEVRDVRFSRDGGPLEIDVGDLSADDIEWLDVGWPSAALRSTTLIDTPGLASIDTSTSRRTEDFFGVDDDSTAKADAVVYLMRHLHRRDVDFLEAFTDHTLALASPANAVAVLSRADEIGAGRFDALDSARRIADRYRQDTTLRRLCASVIPVAGLVAETGLTLRESEFAALRLIATSDAAELDHLLVSVDRFCTPGASELAPAARHELLGRLGLFGVRFACRAIRSGQVSTASGLASALVEVSGLSELERMLADLFAGRARLLKARSALHALRAVARELTDIDDEKGRALEAQVERIEASSHDFAQLRLLHLVVSGIVAFGEAEADELSRLLAASNPAERAGCAADAPPSAVRATSLEAVDRWRRRGADPRTDVETREACEIMARSYEGLYLEATTPSA